MAFNPFEPAPKPKTPLGHLRILSSTAGIRASPLQLGAMSLGAAWGAATGKLDKDAAFKLMDAYAEAGGNFIDTANHYQMGDSESWIGEWLAARGNRDAMILATKYTTDFAWDRKFANHHGNHKKSMMLSLENSLKLLKTNYVDIFYVHWWDHSTSIREVIDSLHNLVQKGKVLYLGISDTPAWIVAAANEYALANGKTPFSIYQGRWNVLQRDFERDILPMARHYGMALAPFGVAGQGKFQTKAEVEARKERGEALRGFGVPQSEAEIKMSAALEKVAKEIGAGYSPVSVAIAYVLAKAPKVFPVIGGTKVGQLNENIKALEIRLSKEQIKELERVSEFDLGFPLNFIGNDPKVTGEKGGLLLAAGAYVDWESADSAVGY